MAQSGHDVWGYRSVHCGLEVTTRLDELSLFYFASRIVIRKGYPG
jgi:hypothetical protein